MAEKLTQTEAEAYLGITRPTLLKLIQAGKVRFEKDTLDGRRKLFKKSELQKLKEGSK
jgi:excisionase family DNA binding protein